MNHTLTSGEWLVRDVMEAMEQLAPAHLAEPWDAVGLQVGDPSDPVRAVVLALDVTPEAMSFAAKRQANLIISHHPVIFNPLSVLRRDDPEQALLMRLVEEKTAVLAAHTNLDAAAGGVADSLAATLTGGLPDAETAVNPVSPYGRLIHLRKPLPLSDLAGRCRDLLGASGCLLQESEDRPVRCMAVFPGSFSADNIAEVRRSGADCLLCGECKHSTGLQLRLSGCALLQLGHDVSERVVLPPLAGRMRLMLPGLPFAVYAGLVYNEIAFRVSRTAAGVSRKAAREESPGSKGQGAG